MKNQGLYHKLWIDGELVSSYGEINSKNKFNYYNLNIKNNDFYITKNSTEIIMQISNSQFSHAGFWEPIKIGFTYNIDRDNLKKNIFYSALIGILFISSIYHIFLFLFRKKNPITLCFALFSITVAVHTLFTTEIITILYNRGLPFEFRYKVEYSCIFIGTFLVTFYFKFFLQKRFPELLLKVTAIYSTLFLILILFTNIKFYDNFVIFFFVYLLFLICYIVFLLFLSLKEKYKNSLFLLIGLVIMFVGVIIDYLNIHGFLNNMPPTSFFSFTIFTFIQSLVIARNFSTAFHTIEDMSNELLSLDRLKDEFLANTSHELKTPLTGIIGIADSLLIGVAGELDENIKRNLSLIVSSGRRLEKLVNDILDLSKLKNSTLILNTEPVNIYNITEKVVTIFKTLKTNSNLSIENLIPADFPLVFGDKNRIEQILYNLIGNAIKFTEKGSVVVEISEKNGEAIICIIDSGIGIPLDKRDGIFNSFEQADGSISKTFGGTGLGLTITKKLVEMQSGKIWFDSKLSIGTTFFFTLPISMVQLEESRDVLEFSLSEFNQSNEDYDFIKDSSVKNSNFYSQNSNANILVVDDEIINLQVLLNYLNLKGYNTTIVNSGIDALQLLEKEHNFDLIILDVMLPKMSGYDVCEIIRKTHNLFDLPVLMLTAKSRPEEIINGFLSGANDYLQKPFDKNELFARINALISLKISASTAILKTKEYEKEKQKRIITENLISLIKNLASTLNNEELAIIFINHLHTIFEFNEYFILDSSNNSHNIICSTLETELNFTIFYNYLEKYNDIILNSNKIYCNMHDIKLNNHVFLKQLIAIPLVKKDFFNIILFIIPVLNNPILHSMENEIYTLTKQAEFAFENVWYINNIEQKTKELTDFIEKLKFIENTTLIIYTEPDANIAIKHILDSIILDDSLPYKSAIYMQYNTNLDILTQKLLVSGDINHNTDIISNYSNIIDNSINNNKPIINVQNLENNTYLDFFPIRYKSNIFGVIILEKNDLSKEVLFNENSIIQIFIKNISIYLENLSLKKLHADHEKLEVMINFSKAIIHEFRTPISVIKGFSKMAETKISNIKENNQNDLNKIANYLHTISNESERIDKMAKELLQYASTNDFNISYEDVSIKNAILEAIQYYKSDISLLNIEIINDIDNDSNILTDYLKFIEIFKKIIKNSIEAVDYNKKHNFIKFKIESELESLIISIEDNGIGIASDVILKIFDPLKSGKIQGTGLGLTIVKYIMDKLKGTITISSKLNVGTTVFLHFKK